MNSERNIGKETRRQCGMDIAYSRTPVVLSDTLQSDWLASRLKVKHRAKRGDKILKFCNDKWLLKKNQPQELMSVGE